MSSSEQTTPQNQFKSYYQEMFHALQNGDRVKADRFRALMAELRLSYISSSNNLPNKPEIIGAKCSAPFHHKSLLTYLQ